MATDDHTWALLARTPSLDSIRLRALHAGGIDLSQLRAQPAALLQQAGLSARGIAWLREPDHQAIAADLAAMQRHQLTLLPATATGYPPQLAQINGTPAVLWVRGSPAALCRPQLAMVGTRSPSADGLTLAFEFAEHFTRGGLLITSGLAYGIDAAAHDGALAAGGPTIAVCGTGLDTVYPTEHRRLAERIVANGGCLVSEFPPGSEPEPWRFPARNRLMSALALGVLVVEAARRSGSLITARHAGDQGREVFAIPGSIHNPNTRGCHQLIRQGAKLVEDASDVFSELQLIDKNQSVKNPPTRRKASPTPARGLDNDAKILLHALAFEAASLDTLVTRTALPAESVAASLLLLELEGLVIPQPGGRFSRLRGGAASSPGEPAPDRCQAPTDGMK